LTGFLKQFYFNSHLPSLTSCSENICPADFYVDLINKTLV